MGRVGFPDETSGALSPGSQSRQYDDFRSNANPQFTLAGTGTGTGWVNDGSHDEDGHPGVARADTGSTATGSVYAYSEWAILPSSGKAVGECVLDVTQLSNASEEFVIQFGWTGDGLTTAANAHGIYMIYDRAGLGVNWHCCTENGSVSTDTDSSTAVAASWVKLKMIVDLDNSSADYYINDALVVSNQTANFPTLGATDRMYFNARIVKTVGTTSVFMKLDYLLEDLKVVR